MPVTPARPSWRKPAGVFLILLLIVFWAWLAATVADWLPASRPLRLLFFVAAGLVWILPLKPLLRWMELGKWRE
ncbi:MAG TPA: DUF2842 domain-containing protein [Allosphingosinicella sp.]|nr:DUF2842 domain-containing protein [Allosphingosinicella sp.]